MPIALSCPNCRASFRLADELAGRKVKCKSCQHLFVAAQESSPAPALDMELDDKPAETAVSTKPAPPKPKEDPDDAIEAPKAPSKPPPLKKSSSTERPTTKARRKPASTGSGSGGMTALLLVLLGGGLLVCVGGMCIGGYIVLGSRPAQAPLPGPIAGGDLGVVQVPPKPPEPPPPVILQPPPPPIPPEPPRPKPKLELPAVIPGPDPVGKSFVANSFQMDGFQLRELTLAANITTLVSPNNNMPVWDAEGVSVYWLSNNTLQKVSREGKLEASVVLPGVCHQLALTSEGLVTLAQPNEVWLIDTGTFAVKARINCPGGARWIGGSPASATTFVLTGDLQCIDLKAQRHLPVRFQGGLQARGLVRSVAVSPDGKFVCTQFSDYACHRYRVDGFELHHEATKLSPVRAALHFQFSPDSKQVVMTPPTLSPASIKKVNVTDVYAIESWDRPIYSLPGFLRVAAFDTKGGLYATFDKELRYYADPAAASGVFKTLDVAQPARRLLTPPQGVGCLMLAQQQSYLIEPTAKR